MKRDMDLIRNILTRIEDSGEEAREGEINLEFEGQSQAKVMYHIALLASAGYVDAVDSSSLSEDYWIPTGLTWIGHDFIEATHNQTIWNSVKEKAKEFGGSIPLDIAKTLALKLVSDRLGISL